MKWTSGFIRVFDFLSSLKLAVITLISLASLLAVGTFYESLYDTRTAQVLIYRSPWMQFIMVMLIINLTCAAMDRFPWKKQHVGFVITHAGIILMLLGSFTTQKRGIDASLGLGLGESSRSLFIDEPEITVYESSPTQAFKLIAQRDVDFIYRYPRDLDINIPLGKRTLILKRYHPKSEQHLQFLTSDDKAAPAALEFQITNGKVNVQEWMSTHPNLNPSMNLGPAKINISQQRPELPKEKQNEIYFYPNAKGQLQYIISSAKTGKLQEGKVELKKAIATGWMGLQVYVHRYFPHAQVSANFRDLEDDEETATGPMQKNRSVKSLEVQIGDQERWLELNSPQQITFDDGSVYFLSYGFKKIDLGFNMTLKDFTIGRYGGTNNPSAYTSKVQIENGPEKEISMNEPLVHNHFTFYQASFEEDENGKPNASIFSVNYDPGRRTKYAGALMMVGGMISMFYFKPSYSRKKKQA